MLSEDGSGKTVVAVESSEDYRDVKIGFYTEYRPDGSDGKRYRIVTVSGDGFLVPFLDKNRFFDNEKICGEYLAGHKELEVVSYDEIINAAERQKFKKDVMEKEEQEEKTMERAENRNEAEGTKMQFVTIELSRKQVDLENTRTSGTNGKEYARILAPGHGVFFYPADSLKESKYHENRLYFSRPEGTELQVYYSKRKEGVPDSAPNSEKYERHTETVKIEDLKAAYAAERQAFIDKKNQEREAKNAAFVNMTVPTEWGKVFHGNNGKDYVSISIPVPENGDNFKYYSFIIPSERFRESDRQPGNSYFGFPKLKKGSEEEYTIQLKRSEKQEDGSYIDVKKEISSAELKGHVEAALKRAAEKEQQTGIKDASSFDGDVSAPSGEAVTDQQTGSNGTLKIVFIVIALIAVAGIGGLVYLMKRQQKSGSLKRRN